MQVTFKSPQKLGNKPYKAGTQVVADHLACNTKFKAMVKAGLIVVHAKDANAQAVQASKDAQNVAKAEKARVLTAKMKMEAAAKAAAK